MLCYILSEIIKSYIAADDDDDNDDNETKTMRTYFGVCCTILNFLDMAPTLQNETFSIFRILTQHTHNLYLYCI